VGARGEATIVALPDSSRAAIDGAEGGDDRPREALVQGPFKLSRTVGGVSTWEAPLPTRPRNLFFQSAPRGMTLRDAAGKKWAFADTPSGSKRARTWDFTAKTLILRQDASAGQPQPGALYVQYDKADEREDALNFGTAGLSEEAFAFRSLQLGQDTRFGVFLPAPGEITWSIDALPAAAALSLDGVILPPEVDQGQASDGATLEITLEVGGQAHAVRSEALQVGAWAPLRLDLSAWAGQPATLRFATSPGEGPLLDYVFLAEPTLYTPVDEPERLLVIFIDTLRADHMGAYGYERETSPRLDAMAASGVVFEQARSVAPWTLPSTRSALSGRQPELFRQHEILPEILGAEGWATGAFVGNVYLSSNFDMADGWDTHSAINWPRAEVQVRRVERFLEKHPDRDAAVMLHVMDMHLPYSEPAAYRYRWAARKPPKGLTERSTRRPILDAYKKKDQREAVRDYVVARYDQNMRYLDDQLADLVESLGPDVNVLIFADHGEEFWDHGGFEHGHTLYEELLRVPLMLWGPGVTSGRVAEPVSLLDVTPTALDMVGLLTPERASRMVGRSLVSAAGDEALRASLAEGGQAFGRPLYGDPRWGVVDGDLKWTTTAGREVVRDLAADPGEKKDLLKGDDPPDREALRLAFAAALGRDAPVVWRVKPSYSSGRPRAEVVVTFRHPGGFDEAWLGEDPLLKSKMELSRGDEGEVIVTFAKSYKGTREIYLAPAGDPAGFGELVMSVKEGGKPARDYRARATLVGEIAPDGKSHTLLRASAAKRSFVITFAVAPVPAEEGVAIAGFDEETSAALKALGYLEDDEDGPAPEGATVTLAGGAVAAWLIGAGDQRIALEGATAVAPGTYTIEARFDGEAVRAGAVTVEAGEAVEVACRAAVARCEAR